MKIAILGWGSLVWQPNALKIDTKLNWNKKGPELPLEFSRISQNGRLTIVINNNAAPVKTLFAVSCYKKLDEAILDLAVREGSSKKRIGFYKKETNEFFPDDFRYKTNIKNWLKKNEMEDIDAVIWTNLSVKFKNKIGMPLTNENVIKYLKKLPGTIKPLAEEYIRKAPVQIDTDYRRHIEKKLEWFPIY